MDLRDLLRKYDFFDVTHVGFKVFKLNQSNISQKDANFTLQHKSVQSMCGCQGALMTPAD